jgi:soluble lytic murein transglycosylase-like protein
LLLSVLVWLPPARADVWGYVDDRGVVHFGSERLDERYELYFVTPSNDKRKSRKPPADPDANVVDSVPPTKLLAFFEVSPDYKQVKHLLREASKEHQIDYALLQALIATESGFDARAVSPRGAVGLMQLMPATAQVYGVTPGKRVTVSTKLKNPRTNIRAGCLYLRDMMARFPGRLDLSLAAYNSGLKSVRRAGNKVPPFKETRNFVRTVLQMYAVLKPPHMKPGARPVPLQDQAFSRNKSN